MLPVAAKLRQAKTIWDECSRHDSNIPKTFSSATFHWLQSNIYRRDTSTFRTEHAVMMLLQFDLRAVGIFKKYRPLMVPISVLEDSQQQ
jgi:hypothetical protein